MLKDLALYFQLLGLLTLWVRSNSLFLLVLFTRVSGAADVSPTPAVPFTVSPSIQAAQPYLDAAVNEANQITNTEIKGWAYKGITEEAAMAGDLAGGHRYSLKVDSDYKGPALNVLAREQMRAGKTKEAYQEAERLKYNHPEYEAVIGAIAIGKAQTGDINGAITIADSIKEPVEKQMAYCSIATRQAKSGDLDGARKTIATLVTSDSKSYAIRRIAQVQVDTGDLKGAIVAADSIEDVMQRLRTYSYIAEAQQKAGDTLGVKLSLARSKKAIVDSLPPATKASALGLVAVIHGL